MRKLPFDCYCDTVQVNVLDWLSMHKADVKYRPYAQIHECDFEFSLKEMNIRYPPIVNDQRP